MLLPGPGCPWGLHCLEWLNHWSLGFGVLSSPCRKQWWISSPWERELVEPGCVVWVAFLSVVPLAVVLIPLLLNWTRLIEVKNTFFHCSPILLSGLFFDLDPFPLWLAMQLQECFTCQLHLAPPRRLTYWLQVKCALVGEMKLQLPFSSFKLSGLPEAYSL